MRQRIPDGLRAALAVQEGVVTRGQALKHLSRAPLDRLVRDGVLAVLSHGVYRSTSAPVTAAQWGWAARLVGGPGSAIGGWRALELAGLAAESLAGRGRPTSAPALVTDVWLPRGARLRPRGGFTFRIDGSGRLAHTMGTLPRIRAEDAVLDVGSQLDLDAWVELLSTGARSGIFSPTSVRTRLDARRRWYRLPLHRAVLDDLAGIESTLEFVYLRDVERAHGLPVGRRQASLLARTRSDVSYDEYDTLIELDGRLGHEGPGAFRDLRRDNAHAMTGVFTLRYGSVDIRGRPCAVAAQVSVRLRSRGWSGPGRRCPRCPRPSEAGRDG